MLSFLVVVCLQDVLVEDFDKAPWRDGSYPGWNRVIDEKHPHYNTIDVVDQAIRLRSFASAVTLRHGGVAADARLSYRLSVTTSNVTARASRAWAALRWLDREGRPLRTDTAALVEAPPEGAARVEVELHLDGPDVRSEARFDTVRLIATPRIELRPAGRTWPVWRARERIDIAVAAPALPGTEFTGRLLNADGGLERTMTIARGALSTDPLPAGAYRLEVAVSGVTREEWVYVLGPPLFEPAEPEFGVVFRKVVADPAAIADVAGARHVAVAFPAAEPLIAPLARRHDTLLTAIAKPTSEQRRAWLQQIDYWVESIDAARWLEADAPTPALYERRTMNDLLGGATAATAPAWAPGARAYAKRGRTIVAVTEATPPAGWLVVDPLRGVRPAGSVKSSRLVYLVSPP
jgi:hypothetical protein